MPFIETTDEAGHRTVSPYFKLSLHLAQSEALNPAGEGLSVMLMELDEEKKATAVLSRNEVAHLKSVCDKMLEFFGDYGPNEKGWAHIRGEGPADGAHDTVKGDEATSLKSIALTKAEWKHIFFMLKYIEAQAVKEDPESWEMTERGRRQMVRVAFGDGAQ
jgi:hypothetical protein